MKDPGLGLEKVENHTGICKFSVVKQRVSFSKGQVLVFSIASDHLRAARLVRPGPAFTGFGAELPLGAQGSLP